jgi:uncharacterized protein YjbI with pentapeptide repeats
MKCPHKPKLWNPYSILYSLFGAEQPHAEIVEMLKETVEDRKDSLDGGNLQLADLREANLSNAGLRGADLTLTGLTDAQVANANCTGAILRFTVFRGASLVGTDFTDAVLDGVLG